MGTKVKHAGQTLVDMWMVEGRARGADAMLVIRYISLDEDYPTFYESVDAMERARQRIEETAYLEVVSVHYLVEYGHA